MSEKVTFHLLDKLGELTVDKDAVTHYQSEGKGSTIYLRDATGREFRFRVYEASSRIRAMLGR